MPRTDLWMHVFDTLQIKGDKRVDGEDIRAAKDELRRAVPLRRTCTTDFLYNKPTSPKVITNRTSP
jgi:hypothetical protein